MITDVNEARLKKIENTNRIIGILFAMMEREA
jgi:hypothetical protein